MTVLNLIPRPKKIELTGQKYFPKSELRYIAASATIETDFKHYIEFASSSEPNGGYEIHIHSHGIRVAASGDDGRWNAIATLKQILHHNGGAVPGLYIFDRPDFPVRGVMLDVSRSRVPKMETIKRLINIWSNLKFNHLQLYMEHTFAYHGHQTVWRNASPFTPGEIQELDQYCRLRGMELVPNQNSFGHMERWLQHPEYHCYAESPQGFTDPWGVYRNHGSTLDLRKKETMDFLCGLYDQLLPLFRSRSFNIGGDETYDLGLGSNRERCKREGVGPVYLDYLKRIVEEVLRRGYTPQFYSDILLKYPDLLREVPEDTVVLNWGYEPHHPFEKETTILAKNGRHFFVCPGTGSWNSLAGRWTAARKNIQEASYWGSLMGAKGFIVTDWGDNGHHQQYLAALPGWYTGATAAWNGPHGVDEDVAGAIQRDIFGNTGGKATAILLQLADLYLENPVPLHNISFLILPLLDHCYPYYRGQYQEIGRHGIGRARDIARDCMDQIMSMDAPEDAESNWWWEQLLLTAKFMLCAANMSEPFYASGGWEGISWSIRQSLARELEDIIVLYTYLWEKSCRFGGMHESLSGFRALIALLKA